MVLISTCKFPPLLNTPHSPSSPLFTSVRNLPISLYLFIASFSFNHSITSSHLLPSFINAGHSITAVTQSTLQLFLFVLISLWTSSKVAVTFEMQIHFLRYEVDWITFGIWNVDCRELCYLNVIKCSICRCLSVTMKILQFAEFDF